MIIKNTIAIFTLGEPQTVGPLENVALPAKAFQLLTILSRCRDHRISRREAAALLWGSQGEAEGLTNLRQLLARTRRATPADCNLIMSDNQSISLGGDALAIDIRTIDRLLASDKTDDHLEGFRLVRGDLLEGISDTSDEFHHWLTIERARFREQLFSAASSLLIELTRYGRATKKRLNLIADKLLAIAPEREESYRALIEAYGRNGDFKEAERLYQQMVGMLKREFKESPTPETVAVVRRIFAAARERDVDPQTFLAEQDKPRVAFLAPTWLQDNGDSRLLAALIEDIANELTRYRNFVVLAAHSSFKFDHSSGLLNSNATLRADYTVSGFVRPERGENLLVLRMIKCGSGEIKWAGEFRLSDGELSDVFRRTTIRVASSLAIELTKDITETLGTRGTAEAYRHYLDGQLYLKRCDLPRIRKARSAFREAVASCYHLAIAHAGIAQTLYLEWILLGGNDPILLSACRNEADISIHLDPNSAHGHWMKAAAALYQQDFDTSAEKYAEAETLCPNSADLLLQHGDALAYFGDADAAWQRFERAIDLNPCPPDHYWWAGASIAFTRKDYDEAISLCNRLSDDEPVLRLLAASNALAGNTEQAGKYGEKLMEIYPDSSASEMVKLIPYREAADRDLFLEGLRQAGVK